MNGVQFLRAFWDLGSACGIGAFLCTECTLCLLGIWDFHSCVQNVHRLHFCANLEHTVCFWSHLGLNSYVQYIPEVN